MESFQLWTCFHQHKNILIRRPECDVNYLFIFNCPDFFFWTYNSYFHNSAPTKFLKSCNILYRYINFSKTLSKVAMAHPTAAELQGIVINIYIRILNTFELFFLCLNFTFCSGWWKKRSFHMIFESNLNEQAWIGCSEWTERSRENERKTIDALNWRGRAEAWGRFPGL